MKEKLLTIILAALFALAVLLSASCGDAPTGDSCCYSNIPGCCATVTAIPVFLNAPGR